MKMEELIERESIDSMIEDKIRQGLHLFCWYGKNQRLIAKTELHFENVALFILNVDFSS